VRPPAGPWSLTLDDFLMTRMMELAVHSDDLAASVDLPTPALPDSVLDPVLALLFSLAVGGTGRARCCGRCRGRNGHPRPSPRSEREGSRAEEAVGAQPSRSRTSLSSCQPAAESAAMVPRSRWARQVALGLALAALLLADYLVTATQRLSWPPRSPCSASAAPLQASRVS
jgi:hypothetical protein